MHASLYKDVLPATPTIMYMFGTTWKKNVTDFIETQEMIHTINVLVQL